MKAGEVWSSVQKAMGGGGSFTVKSSHAVAGVRGTRFLTASSKSETSVKVFSGKVLVSNKPIYQVEGATKGTRVQVAGPQEVSKKGMDGTRRWSNAVYQSQLRWWDDSTDGFCRKEVRRIHPVEPCA